MLGLVLAGIAVIYGGAAPPLCALRLLDDALPSLDSLGC